MQYGVIGVQLIELRKNYLSLSYVKTIAKLWPIKVTKYEIKNMGKKNIIYFDANFRCVCNNIFTFSRFDHETSTYYFSLILKPSNKIIDNDISR